MSFGIELYTGVQRTKLDGSARPLRLLLTDVISKTQAAPLTKYYTVPGFDPAKGVVVLPQFIYDQSGDPSSWTWNASTKRLTVTISKGVTGGRVWVFLYE